RERAWPRPRIPDGFECPWRRTSLIPGLLFRGLALRRSGAPIALAAASLPGRGAPAPLGELGHLLPKGGDVVGPRGPLEPLAKLTDAGLDELSVLLQLAGEVTQLALEAADVAAGRLGRGLAGLRALPA